MFVASVDIVSVDRDVPCRGIAFCTIVRNSIRGGGFGALELVGCLAGRRLLGVVGLTPEGLLAPTPPAALGKGGSEPRRKLRAEPVGVPLVNVDRGRPGAEN